jgi:hypothetical protein
MLCTSVVRCAYARFVENKREIKAQGRSIVSVRALPSKVLYILQLCGIRRLLCR